LTSSAYALAAEKAADAATLNDLSAFEILSTAEAASKRSTPWVPGEGTDVILRYLLTVSDPGLDFANSVAISGLHAFAGSASGFAVVNISDPLNLQLVATIHRDDPGIDGLNQVSDVAVAGGYAFVTSRGDNALTVIDVGAPSAPQFVTTVKDTDPGIDGLAGAAEVAVSGSFAYVVSNNNDDALAIFDISDPVSPQLRGVIRDDDPGVDGLDGASGIAVEGNVAFVAANNGKALTTIDVSDPDSPLLLGSIHDDDPGVDGLEGPLAVAVADDIAYVMSSGALAVIDVSDPANPVFISAIEDSDPGFDSLSGCRDITLTGDLALVTARFSSALNAIDISDPTSLQIVDLIRSSDPGVEGLFGAYGVALSGDVAFVSAFNDDAVTAIEIDRAITTERSVGIGTADPAARLHVEGDAFISGDLLDSAGGSGTLGQVLSSGASGTSWVDPLDNDPVNELQSLSRTGTNITLSDGGGSVSVADNDNSAGNELQTLSLSGPNLTLSNGGGAVSINDADADPGNELQTLSLANDVLSLTGGGSANLAAYLRSSVSDTYSRGTLTFASDSTLQMDGILQVDHPQGIKFAAGAERFFWGGGRFFTTDGLVIQGPIRTGSIAGINWDYNDFSNGIEFPESGELGTTSDFFIGDDLEIGDGLYLSGVLTMNTEESDQSINFYEDGSLTGESLKWDDGSDRFEFSDNMEVSSSTSVAQLRLEQTSSSNFARLELATVDGGLWRIAAQSGATGDLRFFNGSRDRMILEDNGDLDIDGTLSQGSDRDRKENIVPVDPAEVLDKVAALPIARWTYKDDVNSTPHLGPMSQDFHAAFELGDDERRIPSIDADGVALAAIQALKTENDALQARVAKLESLIEKLAKSNLNE
jgi:hypothetical protein